MLERATSRLATFPRGLRARNAQLTGISATEQALNENLLKLRAVLILLAARHGSKMATARATATELRAKRLKASMRSIYRWQSRYLRFGFAGIVRRKRSDMDCPHRFGWEILTGIVEAATRVKRHGDLVREFRKLRPGISYRSFCVWVRKTQRQLRVVEMPMRGESIGPLL
jgi:hypothetical protein